MTERTVLTLVAVLLVGAIVFHLLPRQAVNEGPTSLSDLCRAGRYVEVWLRLESLDLPTRRRELGVLAPPQRGALLGAAHAIIRARLEGGLGESALGTASWVAQLEGAGPADLLLYTVCARAQGSSADFRHLAERVLVMRPDCLSAYEELARLCFAHPLALRTVIDRALENLSQVEAFSLRLGERLEASGRYHEADGLYELTARRLRENSVINRRRRAVATVLARQKLARSPDVAADEVDWTQDQAMVATPVYQPPAFDGTSRVPNGLTTNMDIFELLQVAGEPTRKSRLPSPQRTEWWRYAEDDGGFYVVLREDRVVSFGPFRKGRAMVVDSF